MRLYLLDLGYIHTFAVHPVVGYLVRTDDGVNVLIDTGMQEDIPPGAPVHVTEEQNLLTQLADLGLRPDDIDYVVCTHFDNDHCGRLDAFPDAEFVVQRAHYELAVSGAEQRLEVARSLWDHPHLKFRLVDGDTELVPGVELIETSGHMPGHQSVLVRLPETGPVVLAIDAIPITKMSDPDTRKLATFDLDEESTLRSTRKLVDLAERENAAFMVYGHDPDQWATLRHAPEYYA